MGPARVALLLGMATVPSGLAYDLEPSVKAHNHACIDWADSAAVAVDGVNPVEVTPGIRLCRTRQVGRDASELASVLDGERDGTCRGNPEYEVATRSTEATVFWHRQNFNALPLPLMTWFGAAGLGVVPMGICRANASIGDTVSWRLGVLHGAGKNYATCQLQDGDLIAGNFDLLGAYNRTVPYVPVLGPDGPARPRDISLKRIRELLDEHITPGDSVIFEETTGTPLHELYKALWAAPNVTVDRFLSADRWVYSKLNIKGLHLLRCTLAERVVNERRRRLGMAAHPDYASFMKNGFLIKDFSTFDNGQLNDLLRMVSGYRQEDLPDVDWTLRSVTSQADDKNTDLHVDSCFPSWKVWLYAQDIDESSGPLTYAPGSHRNTKQKLAWLYKASTDPPLFGAGSYGSFRMGQYGRAWTEHLKLLKRNDTDSTESTESKIVLRTPYVVDKDGVWRCSDCLDEDERDYGMAPRQALTGPKLSLVIADVSGLHARGLSTPGTIRRTFILAGDDNDGASPVETPRPLRHNYQK